MVGGIPKCTSVTRPSKIHWKSVKISVVNLWHGLANRRNQRTTRVRIYDPLSRTHPNVDQNFTISHWLSPGLVHRRHKLIKGTRRFLSALLHVIIAPPSIAPHRTNNTNWSNSHFPLVRHQLLVLKTSDVVTQKWQFFDNTPPPPPRHPQCATHFLLTTLRTLVRRIFTRNATYGRLLANKTKLRLTYYFGLCERVRGFCDTEREASANIVWKYFLPRVREIVVFAMCFLHRGSTTTHQRVTLFAISISLILSLVQKTNLCNSVCASAHSFMSSKLSSNHCFMHAFRAVAQNRSAAQKHDTA